MTNKKYILGFGISSMIYAYYHPEFIVICPKEGIGGKLNNEGIENIIYLHATPQVEEFLKGLDFKIEKKTHLIKYVKNNVVKDEIVVVDKIQMIKKKLDDKDFEVKDTKLSVDDYFISVYEINLNELVEKLKKTANIIDDKVIRITDNEIITEKTRYSYDSLISTIPSTIFWKLYHRPTNLEFKSKDITFVLCDDQPNILSGVKYKLCYFLDDKYKYTRVSERNGKYLYEFTGNYTKEEVKNMLPKNIVIKGYYVEKNAIIYSNENNIPPKNIQFLGRFAKFQHSYKINNVIEDSQWNYDFKNIWNIQKSFFNKVYPDVNLKLIPEKEQLTQKILLHLQAELIETLNETNYKDHKPYKNVDVDKIKEELIDVQKYLLTLFLIWDISCEDFVRIFEEKSKIVEKRWENQNE